MRPLILKVGLPGNREVAPTMDSERLPITEAELREILEEMRRSTFEAEQRRVELISRLFEGLASRVDRLSSRIDFALSQAAAGRLRSGW